MKKMALQHRTLILLSFLILCSSRHAQGAEWKDSIPPGRPVTDYIDPTIGNVGQLLEPTRPNIQLPNQLIRFSPQRKDYLDDQISSFPLTIVSHRLGQVFSMKPFTGALSTDAWERKMTYDHDLEINRPWHYSTWLIDDNTQVEFTPASRSGFFRFKFPEGGDHSLLFDVYNEGPASWHFISDHELEATETYNGDVKVFVYGVFSTAGSPGSVKEGRLVSDRENAGNGARAYITFPARVRDLVFKYAISYVSPEQARKTFAEQAQTSSFDQVEESGRKIWNRTMSQITVEGGTEAQKRAFYTALYRCYERMVDISEDGKYYSGYDKQIHTDSRPFYVDDWSWDTYLALHPLRMIIEPAREEDMLQSYVRMYQQSGWMPTFPVLFGDHACMNGFHSSVIFLDAWRKGLRDFDAAKAYEGMRKNSTDATLLPWRNGPKTSLDVFYQEKGYFPALHPGEKETVAEVHPFEKRQAVAVTLGASYDDWALSQMAAELGHKGDDTLFARKANNYKNLWDPEKKFFLPRDDKGNWIEIDPKFDGGQGGRDYYDENNGWTYLWQVQHDIPSLISLMGGNQAFEARLDQLFREGLDRSKSDFWYKFPDATGLTGQHSMGNEPGFHIPYLYNFTGSPWKTQKRVRFLLDTWFKDNIFGIPGDEDGGGMSSFVVFSSMGFYPMTPGLPLYTIGSPVFRKVTIDLPSGKKFTVIARNCSGVNKYIQGARLNGKAINTPWFTHAQLTGGGTLELIMGPKPDKHWGTGKK